MAGFSFDPQLFNSAIKKMESAESSFSGINGLISDVSSKFPKNYEYKSIVSTACDDLSVASTFVSNYIKTLNHTNEDLAEKFLDPTSNIKNSDLLDHLGDIFSDTGAFWQGKVFSSLRGDILNYINLLKKTGATILIVDSAILSGVANIGEAIFDGVYAISAFSGAAGAKIHDYFYGTNTSSQIMDETLDFLRRDLSGEAKEKLFSTKVGQAINKQSVLKYDSEVANKIEAASEFTAKVAAAVAATVFTGGAASVAFGALYGAGNKLENYANKVDRENGENYNYTEAILKGASGGVTGAMEWWGYGGLGSFALNGVKALSAFKAAGGSLSLSGIRNAAPLIRKSVALRDFGKNYFKELFAKDNIIDSGSVITDDLLDYYYGDITKAELVKDVKSELTFAALFSSIGALGRGVSKLNPDIDSVHSTEDDFSSVFFGKSDYDSLLAASSSPYLNLDVGETIIDKPKVASPDYFREIDNKVKTNIADNQIRNLAKRIDVSEEKVKQILDFKMAQFFIEGEFGVRKSQSTLEHMLFGDGRMKSQFETEWSGGLYDPKKRLDLEEDLFGVPRDLDVADRPVYGMLIPSLDDPSTADYIRNGPGCWYGKGDGVVFVMDKSKVIDSTTYTLGDSLDYERFVSAGTAKNPQFNSAYPDFASDIYTKEDLVYASLTDLFRRDYYRADKYLELQFHGIESHGLDKVKEILFTKGEPSKDILDELTRRGIKYRIMS